jgi:formylglycine-generating enzyme required for sulfatase activity
MSKSGYLSTLILLCFFFTQISSQVTAATTAKTTANNATGKYTEPLTGMEFVAIPSGTFTMGNNQDRSASPEHQVSIKPFLLGKYEVTFGQYAKFCSSTGRQLPKDDGWPLANRPVVNVTWDDAVAFTVWLSEKNDMKFRLPSESEWEYAARGGAKTKYPWGDQIGKNKANCDGCGSKWDGRMTAPIGSFTPNGFGLYDMAGNVYEWCLDQQHVNYEGATTDGSAWLTDKTNELRVNRGGSWFRPPVESDVTARCWDTPDRVRHDYGFRVVREL